MTTTGTQTVKNRTASDSTPPIASWRYMNPTRVLRAMSTTLVGVATFSETRNSSVRMEKVQMSIPLQRKVQRSRRGARGGAGRGCKSQRLV